MDIEAKRAEIEQKAIEIGKRMGCKVTPFLFVKGEEFIVGYIKDPSRVDKMKALDLNEHSPSQAGVHLLITSLIREESDPRILDETPENDPIYLGAIEAAKSTVSIYNDLVKKK